MTIMIYKFGDQRSQDRLAELQKGLDRSARDHVEVLYQKATGYGWGRTDSPGYVWPAHKGDALDFGINYAIHALTPGATHALREAFELWHAGIGLDKVPDERTCEGRAPAVRYVPVELEGKVLCRFGATDGKVVHWLDPAELESYGPDTCYVRMYQRASINPDGEGGGS